MNPVDNIVCPQCGQICASALQVASHQLPAAIKRDTHCACGMTFRPQAESKTLPPIASNPVWVDFLLATLNGAFELSFALSRALASAWPLGKPTNRLALSGLYRAAVRAPRVPRPDHAAAVAPGGREPGNGI